MLPLRSEVLAEAINIIIIITIIIIINIIIIIITINLLKVD